MFVNLETSDFREAMWAHGSETWIAIAIRFLQRNDRNVAVGNIAAALQLYAVEQPKPEDHMLATLFSIALVRVDYYTLALEVVQRVEAADPTLIKDFAPEGKLAEEELPAS